MLKISIITVSYNSERTIGETIKSVLSQTYPFIEYIIIDGNSNDNTLAIIKNYESRVNKLLREPDNGIYDAMNKGIAMATGDVIGILNSDDIFYDEQVIEKIAEAFSKNTELDCLYGNIVFFGSDKYKTTRTWKTKQYSRYYFELGEVPPHPALFVKANVYKEAGLYKTDFQLSADQEFMLRILKLKKYKSFFLDQYIVRMRIGGASTMGLKSYLISTREIKRAWNSNGFSYPVWLYILRPIKKAMQLIQKSAKNR